MARNWELKHTHTLTTQQEKVMKAYAIINYVPGRNTPDPVMGFNIKGRGKNDLDNKVEEIAGLNPFLIRVCSSTFSDNLKSTNFLVS